ncbi:hypothetical protein LTR85_006950 [Meristemomyces frigidus]|nr:hypothetical protein LTR85_006950 [Meristemomyces frigidus]
MTAGDIDHPPCGDRSHAHAEEETERMSRRYCDVPKLVVPRAHGGISTVHQRSMSQHTLRQDSEAPRTSRESCTRPQAKLDEKTYVLVDKMAKRAAARGASRPRTAEKDEHVASLVQQSPVSDRSTKGSVEPRSAMTALVRADGTATTAKTANSSLTKGAFRQATVSAHSTINRAEMGKAKAVQLSPAQPILREVKPKEDAWEMVDEDRLEEEQWVTDGF